jgi:sec-independent protein translocase protein TatB
VSFLGVGYQEILLVFVLMLVVIGPERMPKVAYQIGKAVRTMQGYARVVRDEFQGEFDYFKEESEMIKGELAGARESLRETEDVLRTEKEQLSADLDVAAKSMEADVEASTSKAAGAGISTLSAGASDDTTDAARAPEPDAAEDAKPLLF